MAIKKRFFSFDVFVSLISFLVFATSIFLVVDEKYFFGKVQLSKRDGMERVAEIVEKQNDVRRKLEQDLIWQPAENQTKLVENELLFTGDSSQASIKLNDGSVFSLDANSLIVIQSKNNQSNVEIFKGGLSGTVGKRVKLSLVNAKGKKTELDATKALVRVNVSGKGGSKIDVLGGEAQIKVGKKVAKVQSNESLKINKGAITEKETYAIRLQSPQEGFSLWNSQAEPIRFQWSSVGEGVQYQLIIAKDDEFKEVVYRKTVSQRSLLLPVREFKGYFYWKVIAYKGDESVGKALPRQLIVKNDVAPRIVSPVVASTISQIMKKNVKQYKIPFQWRTQSGGNLFEVQVASDARFQSVLLTKTFERRSFILPLSEGKYYWRVRVVEEGRGKDNWSVGDFALKVKGKQLNVQDLYPKRNQVFTFLPKKLKNIDFSWDKGRDMESFRLQVSKSGKFSQSDILIDQQLTKDGFSWKPQASGKYFWRIQAVSDEGEIGKFNQAREFSIREKKLLPPPKIELDSSIIEVRNEPSWIRKIFDFLIPPANAKSVKPIPLKWPNVQGAMKYRLQVSKSNNFKKTLVDTVISSPYYGFTDYSYGTFYWRVAAIDRDGDQGKFSSASKLSLKPKAPEIDLLKPITVTVQHPNEELPEKEIQLSWKANPLVDQYLLEVSNDKDFDDKKSFRTTDNKLTLKRKMTKEFYWRISFLNSNGERFGKYSKINRVKTLVNVDLVRPEIYDKITNWEEKHFWRNWASVDLKWKQVEDIESYEWQVARDQSFNNIIKSGNQKDLEVSKVLVPNKDRSYYWRVRSRLGEHRSKWNVGKLRVTINNDYEPPKQVRPSGMVRTAAPRKRLIFEWKPSYRGRLYILEIALDSNFKRVVKRIKTSRLKYELEVPTKIDYYWRVKGFPVAKSVEDYIKRFPNKGMSKTQRVSFAKHFNFQLFTLAGLAKVGVEQKVTRNLPSVPSGKGSGIGVIGGVETSVNSFFYDYFWKARIFLENTMAPVDYNMDSGESISGSASLMKIGGTAGIGRRFFKKFLISLEAGVMQVPQYGVQVSGGSAIFIKKNVTYSIQKASFFYDMPGTKLDIGGGFSLLQDIKSPTSNMTYSPELFCRYPWEQFWFGGFIRYTPWNLELLAKDADGQTVPVGEVTNTELALAFTLGIDF